MGRTKTGLDAQKLLIDGSGGVGGDLCAACPPYLMISLVGLSDCLRMAREEVCQDKKRQVRKSKVSLTHSRKFKERKLTIDNIFNLMEVGGQHRLFVGPGGALALELGQKSSLFFLGLVLRLLEQLLLLGQLRSKQIALRSEFAALLPLDAQGGVNFTQLPLKSSVVP